MITLIQGSGNHSNRLLQAAHFEAYCLENNYKFKNLDFNDMAELYKGCETACFNLWNRFLFLTLKVVRKLQNKTGLKLINIYDYDLINRNDDIAPRDGSFVCGWNFRRNDLVKKYRAYFKQKYALKSGLYKDNSFVNDFLTDKESAVCVGLHIRRGDYKNWNGGIWYYESDVYIEALKQIERLVSSKNPKKKILFYVFSNEDVSSWFKNYSNVRISNNEWYLDQFLMSKMDYLIGPPSTFTMWASYIGDVPLFHIESAKLDFSLESFVALETVF